MHKFDKNQFPNKQAQLSMKIRHCMALLVLASLYSASGAAQTDVNTYEPATFPADYSSLTGEIAFPEYSGNTSTRVYCDAGVLKSGKFRSSYYWSPHENGDSFIKAALRGTNKITISPARINGVAVPVRFQFTVQFEKRDETEHIFLFPHQFIGIRGTGEGYTGPQRYNRFSLPPGTRNKCAGRFSIRYSMLIPADGGKPTNVTTINESDNARCAHHLESGVERGLFIPAFLHGVPIAAPYREVWTNQLGL